MSHLTDDDLVLHYYGELPAPGEAAARKHLSGCDTCRRTFTRLQRVLGAVNEPALAPDVEDGFERRVWARLQPDLRPERRSWQAWLTVAPAPLALAAAVLVLVGAAFFAGRVSSPREAGSGQAIATTDAVRERILLVDLGEHLDRSQMILVELVSAGTAGAVDLRGERSQAEELLAANRLYRHTAAATGDSSVSDLLEDLERLLVEVAAGPERLSDSQLDAVRKQVEATGLLFRVRVVSSALRDRQKEAIQRRTGQRS